MDNIYVGLIGFGTIGTGLARILLEKNRVIESRLNARVILKAIADIDTERDRGIDLSGVYLTDNADEIIEDSDISIIVELIGGYEPARTFILNALDKGKHIVTANKALLAKYGNEIFKKVKEKGAHIGFEASVAGGIPVIRSIKDALVADKIFGIKGILNGTCNYILSKMTEEGSNYNEVLKEAQRLGIAEADPTLDVEGIDTAHKLAILTALAYQIPIPESIPTEGIANIDPLDLTFARDFGYVVKLLAIARRKEGFIEARVHPTMVPVEHPLASVTGAYNAVHIEGEAVGKLMLFGLGAGMMPTASAVAADVVEIANRILHGGLGINSYFEPKNNYELLPMGKVESKYYFRFSAMDQPGVLSKVSGVLARHSISIEQVIQKGRREKGYVPIVMLTHKAQEEHVQMAAKEIDRLSEVSGKSVVIRVA